MKVRTIGLSKASKFARLGVIVITLGISGCIPSNTISTEEGTVTSGDINTDQLSVEQLALRLWSEPQVTNALQQVKEELRKRPGLDSPDGVARLDQAAEEFAFAGLLTAANSDPAHPRIVWFNTPAHRTGDIQVPGSRIGFDNTDRVYRVFPATIEHSYELRGKLDPSQQKITLLLEACEDKPPGWGYPLAFLYPEDMEVNEDGSFVITIDGTAANGRKNHLQLPAGTGHVLIRDTISDWAEDTPALLKVKRTGGPTQPPRNYADMLAQAPEQIILQNQHGMLWYESDTGFSGPANLERNTIPTVYIRPTVPGRDAWGMIGVGKYSVADDEALVFTIEAQNAGYLSLQITDPWMISIDFVNHTSTLNNAEVWVAPDNTVTYVISPTDPGVLNWLDTGGLNDGVMLLRWEQIGGEPRTDSAIRSVELIKLDKLQAYIPSGMPTVDEKQRAAIRKARLTEFRAREAILLGPQQE